MLTSEFGNKIKNFIFLNKEIPLPGLGVFKLHHINQFLSPNESIIHPPQQKIRFESSSTGSIRNSKFKNYYINKVTLKELEFQFQDTINNLLNFGKDEVKGLGKLSLDDEGSVHFISENLIDAQNKYLPIIDTLTFPMAKVNEKPLSKRIIPKINVKQDEKLIYFRPNVNARETKTLNAQTNYSPSKSSKFVLWATLASALFLIIFLVIKKCDFNKEINATNEVLESRLGTVTEDQKITTTLTNELITNKVSIVVGSFLEKRNAQKLISDLNQSLSLTIIKNEDYYRVVVIEENDPQVLEKIRSSINPEAWVLVD
ncbi:MAG: SPOR domain-containing protein [Saprospiraceae bacterium]|nr:SPOR domain-containing protein [Saprospiraceae bacterium]|tara:strand:- start:919 stop:1863 length:945 start_codon:yes stop_codon:yes gene_type:complete